MSGRRVTVRTPNGVVTSRRVAWQNKAGRDVWVWRTDAGAPPLVLTEDEARAWIRDLTTCATKRERLYFEEHWHLEPVPDVRGFAVFGGRDAVGLDELLSQIPADVEPQDVTLQLQLRGVETEVVASWEDSL